MKEIKTGVAELDALTKAATTLLEVIKQTDGLADKIYPEEIVSVVKLHAKLATASALIPIPGVDLIASATSIWSMYVRLNNKLEIPFKENAMKTIASGISTNLLGYVVSLGIGSGLKLIPGIGTIMGTTLMLAGLYATTLASGWIYIKVLTILAQKNKGIISLEGFQDEIKEFMKNNKGEIKDFINNAIKFYKKNKKELKVNPEEKEKLEKKINEYN